MKRESLHIICQAHLDPVWLWPWRDGFAEVLTTLQSAADRLHEYPDLRYTCSAAYAYRWVQETDPRLFRDIRTFVEAGRWEVVGGWVVQADTLLPSETSLRRQGQLAQDWFRENLGVTATVGYCVDSFGHSAGLPSILAGAGMRYYVFQRPRPEENPDLPNLFWWEAPDGARVLTWRLALGYGQPPGCTADQLGERLRTNWRRVLAPDMPVGTWFVGVGNHGGGPTRVQLDRICELRAAGDPALPELRFSTLADFFAEVERQPSFADVPVIRGELLHHARGCYAANTRLKRLHRQAERELRTAECLQRMRDGEPPATTETPAPPPGNLRDAWWTLCFNQFHDILPGSSVATAYDEVRDELGAVCHAARRVTVAATHALARRADTRGTPEGVLFLANPLPWARTAVVRLDAFVSPHGDSPITHLAAPDGERLPMQWSAADAGFGPHLKEWKKLVAAVPLPAAGSRWFHLAHGDGNGMRRPAEVNAQLVGFAESARLVVVEDRADTWGHAVNRWDRVLGGPTLEREKLLDDGPVFRRRRRWLTWGASAVALDIVEWHPLHAVELVLHITWQDRFQTLKLELPMPAPQPRLHVRTPAAVVDRPLDGDEWFWGDWLSLTVADRRILVVSDGVAAYDATPERLRLTLLRCVPHAQHNPVPHPEDSPAPFLDEGHQRARFWLAAPGADTSEADLDRLAASFLTPAEQMLDSAHPRSCGSDDMNRRVAELLTRMTFEEKVRQLQSFHQNGVPRLGIPHLPVGEVLHGLMGERATSFPQAIALGSTWDPDLIERVATVIAREARAAGILHAFAPMLGLAQDPRWGRVEESFGEDPVLVSRLGVAYIHGLQGRGAARFDRDHLIATAKHFAADGAPLSGQNGGAMEISEAALRETHLLPFEAAVRQAHVGAIMPAHHALNGVPCHGNPWLLDALLRTEWGFEGLVVSDFGDLYLLADVPAVNAQRVTATAAEAALLALASGVDMELAPGPWGAPRRVFAKTLADELATGRVPLALLDRAVARVLRAKLALAVDPPRPSVSGVDAVAALVEADGEEDGAGDLWGKLVRDGNLNVPNESRRPGWEEVLADPAHDALALEAARRAVVLLKNDRDLLPLDPGRYRRIAVVGPLASELNLGGYSTPRPKFYVSPLEGLRQRFAGVQVSFAAGCTLDDTSDALLPAAVSVAQEADLVVAVLGTTRKQMGENLDRDNLDLAGGQQQLLEAVSATGKPVVLVLLNGGPLSVGWAAAHVPGIIECWYLGQATGTALAQVLAGDVNPGGKLPVTIPTGVGRAPCHYYRPPAARPRNYYGSPDAVLFPFGHGLSYTRFTFDDLRISPDRMSPGETATVRVTVTNAGARAGDEVIQLYIRDDVSSRVRPAMELRGFERVSLVPGESRVVSFPVGFEQLRFWFHDGWVVEPGSFTVMVGASCADIRLQGQLVVG